MSLKSIRFFNRNQKKFLHSLKEYDNSIIDYYGIDNRYLIINIKPNDGYYEIYIVYDRNSQIFEFPSLPYEINKKINDYTKCKINITLKINNVEHFPFQPPLWSLENIEYFIPSGIHINIEEYYEYLVNLHNENYKINKSWVPGMQHDSDLLNFIMIANTFDYL